MTSMTLFSKTAIVGLCAAALSACVTTPEPEPIPEPVVVAPLPIQTCTPASQLTKIVIPAEYKEGFTINSVENEPEYITDPATGEVREVTAPAQETKVPYKILTKEEQIVYVNADNMEVTDICSDDVGEAVPG